MRRTEYDAGQAAKRLKVPAAAFRWARHTSLVPAPDVSPSQWSRAAVEAMDADAIQAAMPTPPISGGAAADRIAAALGTPNVIGEKAAVTAFVVRRFVDRGLLVDLSATPDGTLHHPGQVDQVCRREDLAELVAADTPLGPEQAAARLGVRRVEFDWMVRLGWVRSPQSIEVRFGTSRAGAVDVAQIFADKKSGKNALRPELKACHAFLDAGDTLVVPSLDRYGRSLQDLINMVAELRDRGIGFTSLHENLDTTTPGGRLVFHVFAALAEFIRELIVIGTNEGLAAARSRGRVGGRPTVATEEVIKAARDLLPDPGRSITSIAKLLGVSPGTLYNHIPDLRELRAGAVPRQLEAPAK